jgi:hypothetical protein
MDVFVSYYSTRTNLYICTQKAIMLYPFNRPVNIFLSAQRSYIASMVDGGLGVML